jgi:hypothetical protein
MHLNYKTKLEIFSVRIVTLKGGKPFNAGKNLINAGFCLLKYFLT